MFFSLSHVPYCTCSDLSHIHFLPFTFIYIFMLYKFLVVSSLRCKTFHWFASFKLQGKKNKRKKENHRREAEKSCPRICHPRVPGKEKVISNSHGCLLKLLQTNQQGSLPKCSLLLTTFEDQLDLCQAWVIDPRSFICLSSRMQGPLALSRDIKEGCLMLDIKLISCQDFTQPRVTATDMSKPYKKNKHVWCKEPFVLDARLHYAPSLRSDTGCDCSLGGRVEACRVSN